MAPQSSSPALSSVSKRQRRSKGGFPRFLRRDFLRPSAVLTICSICAFLLVLQSMRILDHNPSVSEYLLEQQQLVKTKDAGRQVQTGDTSQATFGGASSTAARSGESRIEPQDQSQSVKGGVAGVEGASGAAGASVLGSLSSSHGVRETTPGAETRGREGAGLVGSSKDGASAAMTTHSSNRQEATGTLEARGEAGVLPAKGGFLHAEKASVLKRELRWTIFPLLSRVVAEASEAITGDSTDKDRERERARQEELVRKIERWSNRPSSLCFGHGNLTIVTVTVDLPQEYVVHMRKNRLHYCSLVHQCRYCDIPVSLDYDRPVAWTKVKAMRLILSFSDTVVHMDADALIVNASISFSSLVAALGSEYNTTQKDVIYTTDYQFGRKAEPTQFSLINTGVYIMHSTNWTRVRVLEYLSSPFVTLSVSRAD